MAHMDRSDGCLCQPRKHHDPRFSAVDRLRRNGPGFATHCVDRLAHRTRGLERSAAMSNFGLGVSLFGAMLTLMVLRVPISVAMFLPGAIGYWILAGDASLLNHLKGAIYARFSSYDLSVIPLFNLMGQFATQGGLSRSLFKFASALIGHLRGGVAMAAIVAFAVFGAGWWWCGRTAA